MIYLIKSACYKNVGDKNCKDYEDILKIGYTMEESKKSRFDCYITENPSIQILYLIPGGTEQDERNLHYHFRKYKKYGREWFSYEQEILDFFETHTTKESLEELKPYRGKNGDRFFYKYHKELNKLVPILSRKYISKVLSSLEVSDEYVETIENLTNKLYELLENSLDVSEVDNYFKTTYPGINFSEEVVLDSAISKEIDEIENKRINFTDKMKYIYFLQYDKYYVKMILDNLADPSYSKYYYSISKERASTLKYQKGNLEKNIGALNLILLI